MTRHIVFLWLFSGAIGLSYAQVVQPQNELAKGSLVVTAATTQLKIGNTVLAEVRQGDRFDVLNEAPGWFYIQVETPSGAKLGWINSTDAQWTHPVLVWLEQGKSEEARSFAQAETAQLNQTQGEAHPKTIEALNRLGLAKLASGEAESAIEDFRRVWQERARLDRNDSAGISEAMNNLAVALYRAGKYAEARPLLKQVVQTRRDLLGPAHTESLRSVMNLANFEKIVYSESLDWELFASTEEELQKKFMGGAMAGSPTSADLLLLQEARILHPTLKFTFNAAAFRDEPRDKRSIPETADAAWWLTRMGLFTSNNDYLEEASEICEKVYGKNHFQSALALANVAGLSHQPVFEPDLISAIPEPERALQLESALEVLKSYEEGNELHLAAVHHNLGICLLSDPSRSLQAREHLGQALRGFQLLGDDHPRVGFARETLGLAAYILHDYQASAVQLTQAYEVERKAFGETHGLTTASLNSSGAAYFQAGDFARARSKLETALQLRQQALGVDHSDSIRSMNDLAVVLGAQGDFVGARNLFETCLAGLARTQTNDNWLAQQVEASLWVVRLQMGDYVPAQNYFESVLRSENTYAHRDALANLATLARLQGHLTEARSYLEKAINLFPEDLSLMNDLGAVVREQGDLELAARILGRVVEQRTQDSFPDYTEVAFSLTSLALVEQRLKKFDSAILRFTQALKHYQTELGEQNPRTTEVLRMLGQTELLAGDPLAARSHLAAALRNKLLLAEAILPSLSEAEAMAYVVAFDERDLWLESSVDLQDARGAYDIVWQTRAIATRALAPRHAMTSEDPNTRRLQIELSEVRKALSRIILAVYDSPESRLETERGPSLRALGEQKERLERELAIALQTQGMQLNWETNPGGTVQSLLDMLPADVAVIDFIRVHHVLGQPGWHFEAFVLRSPKYGSGSIPSVQRVPLGTATEIDAAVTGFREQIVSMRMGANSSEAVGPDQALRLGPGWELRKLVWEKLEPQLENVTTIIVVPDGSLTAVPWYALPSQRPGSYLIEDFAIGTAAFPQHVLDLLKPATSPLQQVLLAGGIDYGHKQQGLEPQSFKPAPTRGASWMLLPATKAEVRTIATLAREGSLMLLEGTEASESKLMEEMPKSRFVHLATHGFFADPDLWSSTLRNSTNDHLLTEVQMTADATRSAQVSNLDSVMGRNPLVLSGVVLAGASAEADRNEFGAPIGDDGILTAEEVASLDMRNTELIVLSACETGLGTVAGGEGVFGLQRSFALSGARATISSLWKVDDAATAALMSEFYRNLWLEKMPKLEALRQAQLWMHREAPGKTPDVARGVRVIQNQSVEVETQLPPFYWAAFVLSGDWQ